MEGLHQAGHLFLVDHSILATYPVGTGKYAAACSAYFYLHSVSEQFLPLAIKTNGGTNLTYTPHDTPKDWFLTKTLFESNENLYLASYPWAVTYATAEIVHEAALRSLADEHPVRALLDRVMDRAYAVNVLGANDLFNPGGTLDQNFAFGADGFAKYAGYLYNESAGFFQMNYFPNIFVSNGLINSTIVPPLPHFPYLEDASKIHAVMKNFTTTFVTSYYANDSSVAADMEIQAWAVEANGPAKVYDFPKAPVTQRSTLVDVLMQMVYLTGLLHHELHELNTGSLAASWTLPLHPTSHWTPLPTSKGIESVMPYLPNLTQSLSQIMVEAEFSRPNLVYENGTLATLFTDETFLAATTTKVMEAAQDFMDEMETIGGDIDGKLFDDNGLCQGMPFIWRNLNPRRIPFFLQFERRPSLEKRMA